MNPMNAGRAFKAIVVLVVFAVVGACVTSRTLAWKWADIEPEVLAHATENTDAVAVVLLSEQRFVFQGQGPSREGRTELHYHTVYKLLTEAGLDALSFTMQWPKKGNLLHLDARSVAPDGTVTPVSDREMFSDEASYGKDEEGEALASGVRRFAFPHVEVGSLLEVAWAFEMPGLYTGWSDDTVGSLPIEKYRVEIVIDAGTRPDFMVVNGEVAPRLVDEGDGMQHLVLELGPLPARKSEPLAPSPRLVEPWWIYRTIALRIGGNLYPENNDWSAALRRLAKVVVKNKGAEGATLKGHAACHEDANCLIDAALAETRALPWSGHDGGAFDWTKLNAIEASGSASSSEKALYLWALLVSAGVDAKFAGMARARTVEIDQTFPATTWLNHTVVVARVNGADVWLDPSCEHCARGELPSWSLGQAAVVASMANDEVVADWRVVTGKPSHIDNERRSSWTAQVNADGSLNAALVWSSKGEDAGVSCRDTRDWDAEDWRQRGVADAASVSPSARVVAFTAGVCDRAGGAYQRTVRVETPSWAARTSDGSLIVPLPDFVGLDLHSREKRTSDIVVVAPQTWVHEARVTPPPGFTFGVTPKPLSLQVGGNSLQLEVSREGDTLLLRRTLKLAAGTVPVALTAPLLALVKTSSDLGSSTVTLVPTQP